MSYPRRVLFSTLRNVLVRLELLPSNLTRKIRKVALLDLVVVDGFDQLLKVPREPHRADIERAVGRRDSIRSRFRRQRMRDGRTVRFSQCPQNGIKQRVDADLDRDLLQDF